jgi:hypothetical protein
MKVSRASVISFLRQQSLYLSLAAAFCASHLQNDATLLGIAAT